MGELGLHPGTKWIRQDSKFIDENYKNQSWERLNEIAVENHLDYILQFRSVRYPAAPVFENDRYAVYKVGSSGAPAATAGSPQ
jgi:hypothetical protein